MINNSNSTNGILIIDSYPKDARVYIFNRLLDELTPVEIDLKEDIYHYTIEKNNYLGYSNEIYVSSNKISHIFVNLETREYQAEYVDNKEQLTDFLKIEKEEKKETIPISPVENLLNKLIDNTSYLIDINSKIDNKLEAISLWSEMMMLSTHRRLHYDNYYDVTNTIVTGDGGGFSTIPLDIDSPIYFVDNIHETLERNAELLNIHNQSKASIYIRVSHSAQQAKTIEEEIIQGKVKTYYNVYSVRCRSPLLGAKYEITEYGILEFSDPRLTPLEKASVSNQNTVAFADILPQDLTAIDSPSLFIVYVVLAAPGRFYYVLTTSSGTTGIALNYFADLQEGSLYKFLIPVYTGDSINFATSVTGTGLLTMLRIQETNAAILA